MENEHGSIQQHLIEKYRNTQRDHRRKLPTNTVSQMWPSKDNIQHNIDYVSKFPLECTCTPTGVLTEEINNGHSHTASFQKSGKPTQMPEETQYIQYSIMRRKCIRKIFLGRFSRNLKQILPFRLLVPKNPRDVYKFVKYNEIDIFFSSCANLLLSTRTVLFAEESAQVSAYLVLKVPYMKHK